MLMTKSRNDILKHFEFIFSIFSLIHVSQAIIPLFLTGGANEGDGVNIISLDLSINAKISVLVYLVTFILLAMRWRRSLAVLSSNIFSLDFDGGCLFFVFLVNQPRANPQI